MHTFIRYSLAVLLLLNLVVQSSAQAQTAAKPLKVAILLYPGVELLDFAGPLEVFNHMEGAEVYTVAAKSGAMTIMRKMLTVTPEYNLGNAPKPDILVIPGGEVREVVADSSVISWIQQTTAGSKLTMSVCTGAYLLGKAGLLDGKTVTTHWAATQMLQRMTPKATVMEHTRFVEQGNLLTTAGVSAGIDGALRVVSRLQGLEAAHTIARIMEYDKWEPTSGMIVGQKPIASSKKSVARVSKPTVVKKTPLPKVETSKLVSDIDPVCQMSIANDLAATAYFGGKQYGFCSKICKDRFVKNPTAYLTH